MTGISFRLYEAFDFIVTFSSLEHSGLGRYGDPLDPFGDIKEMRKLRCLLKPGGLFFLGVPTGPDTIVFNAHRIYGRLRLPFMMEGIFDRQCYLLDKFCIKTLILSAFAFFLLPSKLSKHGTPYFTYFYLKSPSVVSFPKVSGPLSGILTLQKSCSKGSLCLV